MHFKICYTYELKKKYEEVSMYFKVNNTCEFNMNVRKFKVKYIYNTFNMATITVR